MRRTRRLGCCHCSDELRVSLDRTRTPVLRRQILVVLGAASLTPLQWASAQTRSGPARLGILSPSAASTEAKWRTVLTARLHELGHEPGRNLVIEERYAEGNYERLASQAEELVQTNVDVILAVASPAVAAAQKATGTIPIVMVRTADPVNPRT